MANRDFLFETKTQDFYKVQANILTEDITNNNFMPEDPRVSKNKGLNTTKKNIVGAINEAFDMAHEAYIKNSGTAFVKTVNGITPNGVGNVDIKNVDRSVGDALGRKIHETYITLNDLPKITKAAARSVNGVVPDSNGDVRLQVVSTINSLSPDRDGNIEINLDNFVTKNELFEEIGDAIKKIPKQKAITVNGVPPDLDNNIVLKRVPESIKATRDGEDNIIADTYITKEKLSGAIDALSTTVVHSINGRTPNSDGTFILDSVPKDGEGNVIASTYAKKDDVYLKSQVDNKIAEAHSSISTPEQLAENAAFKSKYSVKEDVYTKTQTDEKITASINALPNAEILSLNPAFTDKYTNKTAVYTKEETNQKIADAISTVNAQTLSQNTAFTDKFAAKSDVYNKTEADSRTKELISDSAEQLSKSPKFTDVYISKKEIETLIARIYTVEKITAKTKKEWMPQSEYSIGDLIKSDNRIYRITGITPKKYNGMARTGETKYFYDPSDLGKREENDGGFTARFAATINDKNWLTSNKQYSKDSAILYNDVIIKCTKDGQTDAAVPTIDDVKALTTKELTCGTAEFYIVTNKGYATWKPNTIFENGVFLVEDNVFYYSIKEDHSTFISLTGENKPTFTWGTQTNGDYSLTYLGEDSEISG